MSSFWHLQFGTVFFSRVPGTSRVDKDDTGALEARVTRQNIGQPYTQTLPKLNIVRQKLKKLEQILYYGFYWQSTVPSKSS